MGQHICFHDILKIRKNRRLWKREFGWGYSNSSTADLLPYSSDIICCGKTSKIKGCVKLPYFLSHAGWRTEWYSGGNRKAKWHGHRRGLWIWCPQVEKPRCLWGRVQNDRKRVFASFFISIGRHIRIIDMGSQEIRGRWLRVSKGMMYSRWIGGNAYKAIEKEDSGIFYYMLEFSIEKGTALWYDCMHQKQGIWVMW